MEYKHLKRWTLPPSYFGAQWPEYYSAGVGCSRDSSALERANFDAMLSALGGDTGEDDNGISMVCVVTEDHWAVGWVQWIAIHESNTLALAEADKQMERMDDYPVLDEELFSQYEDDECAETWANCFNERERAKYLRDHCGRIQKQAGLFRELRAAVKGDWYAAANLLPCPSDLIN